MRYKLLRFINVLTEKSVRYQQLKKSLKPSGEPEITILSDIFQLPLFIHYKTVIIYDYPFKIYFLLDLSTTMLSNADFI